MPFTGRLPGSTGGFKLSQVGVAKATLLSIALGLAFGALTLVAQVAARPKCPPPCTGDQICSLVVCVIFPVDTTHDIALAVAGGAALGLLSFVLLRRWLRLRPTVASPSDSSLKTVHDVTRRFGSGLCYESKWLPSGAKRTPLA